MKKFSIAGIKPKNQLVLAPMAAVTDLAFRMLCREQGAGLCFTEMVNAEAIARNNKSSIELAQSRKGDAPLGLQLFGARIESMKKAAERLVKQADFDFFDLNLGCPDEKVLRQGAGAALLSRPKRAAELVETLREHGKPVTAKIRINPNTLKSIEFCKRLEQAGVDCITIHAKTVKQGYSGKADFVALKRIVKAIEVPVIANGNLRTSQDVETTLHKTGAAAAMIGRAAIGNPGIFAELQGEKGIAPLKAMFRYLELCDEFGLNRFGRKKTMVVRFLAKAKRKELIRQLQKVKDEKKLMKLL